MSLRLGELDKEIESLTPKQQSVSTGKVDSTAMKQMTVKQEFRRKSISHGSDVYKYKVRSLTNVTTPKINTYVSEAKLMDIIKSGIKVEIE